MELAVDLAALSLYDIIIYAGAEASPSLPPAGLMIQERCCCILKVMIAQRRSLQSRTHRESV